jgi:hypothetical protein
LRSFSFINIGSEIVKLSDGDPENRRQRQRVQFLTLPVRRVSGIAIKHVPRVRCEIFSFLDYQQSNGFEVPVEMELHRGAGFGQVPTSDLDTGVKILTKGDPAVKALMTPPKL